MRGRDLLPLAVLLLTAAGCGQGAGGGGKLDVVAAENFWGSIAAQLGGKKVAVTSIVSNPSSDPADYIKADPGDRGYFERRKNAFESRALSGYRSLIAQIRARYAGVPVGASESIFAPLAKALGLRLLTPAGFLNAVSEGTEPTPADKTTVDDQIAHHGIKVWIYNRQNATPDVQRLNTEAETHAIPLVPISETVEPPSVTFQLWQARELRELRGALASGARR